MKLVIWGMKLHTHTHSYIHYGYWRAAECLGYEVHWYDDKDDVSSVDFSDAVFITEHRVCNNKLFRQCPFMKPRSSRIFFRVRVFANSCVLIIA